MGKGGRGGGRQEGGGWVDRKSEWKRVGVLGNWQMEGWDMLSEFSSKARKKWRIEEV